jgi:hypothetical protein
VVASAQLPPHRNYGGAIRLADVDLKMKSSQEYFQGSKAVAVITAHGVETRYIITEAAGAAYGSRSSEKPEGKPRGDSPRTAEDRTPEADGSPIERKI